MPERSLRDVMEAFYHALNRMLIGDLGPMTDMWSHAGDVTNMGPFGGRQVGWEEVKSQFAWEARQRLGGTVVSQDLLVRVSGDWGFAVCIEQGEDLALADNPIQVWHQATNRFRRENCQ